MDAVCDTDNNVNHMDKTIEAPEAEPEKVIETPSEPVKEVKEEKETIGKVLETDEKPDPKLVPEAAFLKEKTARKQAERDLKALQKSIEEGATPGEVSEDIDAIADEHNIDKKFLNKLAAAIEKTAERKAEEKLAAKMKPIEARERAERIEKVFGSHFDKAMAEMPEFAEVVNRDVIKTLSLDAANQNKTFSQLIEETYGSAIRGKRTLETTTPRGGKTTDKVDVAKAAQDSTYLKEIMADPELKKEYNEGLTDRLSAHL
jgi:hypothetical protein